MDVDNDGWMDLIVANDVSSPARRRSSVPAAAIRPKPFFAVRGLNDSLTISASTLPAWLALVDHGDGTATLRMDGPGPAIRFVGTHEGTAALRRRLSFPLP